MVAQFNIFKPPDLIQFQVAADRYGPGYQQKDISPFLGWFILMVSQDCHRFA